MNISEHPLSKATRVSYLIMSMILIIGIIGYWDGLAELVTRWNKQEEYGHGYFIPLLTIWFLWERKASIKQALNESSYWGVFLVFISSVMLIIGELTAFYLAIQLGFIVFLLGLVLSFGGKPLFKICFVPIFFLIFCIPLPYFLEALLTARLQLFSSEIGVAILRLLGTSVYLEGNVIDLGLYRLQVVEACSGLRYLYPLMGISFLMGYMYQADLWKRSIIFLSAIPITVFMNSARIAVVGILVDYWGIEMADGFLHYFEGWIVFMLCLGVLFFEIWLIELLGDRRPLLIAIDTPKIDAVYTSKTYQANLNISLTNLVIISAATLFVISLSHRIEIQPKHKAVDSFPLVINDWQGVQNYLSDYETRALDLNDYVLADYRGPNDESINFYIAYYASQRKGVSPHSPQVCMPGGGWVITSIKRISIIDHEGKSFMVNRVIIDKNQSKQLVYYWYQERGRRVASEFLMKFYLFKDAIFMNRTDGALIRIVTPFQDDVNAADESIKSFISSAISLFPEYIPD